MEKAIRRFTVHDATGFELHAQGEDDLQTRRRRAGGRCVAFGAVADKEKRLWMKKGRRGQADPVPWHLAGRE